MAEIDCKYFNGYKPCGLNPVCDSSCSKHKQLSSRILIVHLEALGAVLRATSILKSIKRTYPNCSISWVTKAPADKLLENNPLIDRVFTISQEDLLSLSALSFDFAFCIDKSLLASGVLKTTNYDKLLGFIANENGVIIPATKAAKELWEIGLSDHKKFFENKKSEVQLMTEALELKYQKDEYLLSLSIKELQLAKERRVNWRAGTTNKLIGINTGCANVISYKKLEYNYQINMIKTIKEKFKNLSIVLLGGPEDSQRNGQIASELPYVINSPSEAGIRDGLCSVAACDLVITGDSLGMHMAIALKKHTIAWFGPTCAHEIELYGRGEKIITESNCSPCWKRSCEKELMCNENVDLNKIISAISRFLGQGNRQPKNDLGI